MSLEMALIEDGQVTDPKTPKGRLLAAAAHLFRTRGYDRTTVRDLAKAVGIQSGSLFHHYRTKEEILAAVMPETNIVSTARLKDSVGTVTQPKAKLLALIECELRSLLGETGEAMAVLVDEWRTLSDTAREPLLHLRNSYEAIWLDTLREAQQANLLTMDPFIGRRFLTGALAWVVNWYKPDGGVSPHELATEALHLLVKRSEAS